LKADPVEWLLEEENPSIRYFTLIDIFDKPANARDVQKARNNIMSTGIVPKILAKQEKGGYWDTLDKFYTAKYKGTVWQLIILGELGADETNPKIKKAIKFILEKSQDPESGGFSYGAGKKKEGGLPSFVIPCLTGNMVWSLIKLGCIDDPRVQRGIDWITTYQRFDDGARSLPSDWPYNRLKSCFGKHSCHMGVVKAMKTLAEIPSERRSKAVKNTIKEGAEYMLKHHIHRRSHNLGKDSKPGWRRLGFPLMYQTDLLEILGIMTRLGYKDKRMQEAVNLVVKKQNDEGKWKLESTFNGRFQANIEKKGEPSKWITLNTLRMLKRFYG
jgi:hypothetical protein